MKIIIFSLFIIGLFMYSCGPKKVKYEDATKWHSDCMLHPAVHPGDTFLYDEECKRECDDKIKAEEDTAESPIESSPGSLSHMYSEETDKIYVRSLKKGSCMWACLEDMHPIDIANHIEGGYYSDGS